MSRKKKSRGSGLPENQWITTFSDTITLLLTFFILLYSMSTVDANKFKQMATSLQNVLSGDSSNSILTLNNTYGEIPVVGKKGGYINKKSMYEEIWKYITQNKMEDKVEVIKESRGVVLRLKENVLFDTAKADIKWESTSILNMISDILKRFPENGVIVEGHTDNVPISNYKYPSNWDLSTARAVNVLRYFVEVNKMNPDRFTAAGYGEFRPIVSNDNEMNRAKNRRVNIIIEDLTIENKKGETK